MDQIHTGPMAGRTVLVTGGTTVPGMGRHGVAQRRLPR
jgi:NAD(P)-dependent dehydrogenase (short-subunit alcohol dehydrogenase family)